MKTKILNCQILNISLIKSLSIRGLGLVISIKTILENTYSMKMKTKTLE